MAIEVLASIAPFLPLHSALAWPQPVRFALLALSQGPDSSGVTGGEALFDAIMDMKRQNGIPNSAMPARVLGGLRSFFDQLSVSISEEFFCNVLPAMAQLALHLPFLLNKHVEYTCSLSNEFTGRPFHLRILSQQEPGIVILSQELAASLLACSFFCLYPSSTRWDNYLPSINFDHLFAGIFEADSSQGHKLMCLVHYFRRVTSHMPQGNISYERKVLSSSLSDPDLDISFWSSSHVALCNFVVTESCMIEDVGRRVLEVDFANKYLGGGALTNGCVQEEIRFMINPELIVGMLFLPAMADNEAIEIIGCERFSAYKGYKSSFKFAGDYCDTRERDFLGRRDVRIVAIDSLRHPGKDQFNPAMMLREVNKALCGFLDCNPLCNYVQVECSSGEASIIQDTLDTNQLLQLQASDIMVSTEEKILENSCTISTKGYVGIATGNWGCGAFGGDVELKSMLQWLAASQAKRPFMLYCTFGDVRAKRLEEVTKWILFEGWGVSELWSMLLQYAERKLPQHCNVTLFDWLLPDLTSEGTFKDLSSATKFKNEELQQSDKLCH